MADNLPATFEAQLDHFTPQFKAALPAHIPVERFKRVVITALNENPELAHADRRSLFSSSIKAAQDGILPDGREGALVIFNTKVKDANGREEWIKKVQYMPMISGIRKRMRNSDEVDSASAHVVFANDKFDYELGDKPFITHKPSLGERGKLIAAYAIIKLKNGEVLREVMSVGEIEKVRAVSRSKDKGPWKDWYEEMARKTVLRRCAKSAPMQSDLDVLLKRDDELEVDEPIPPPPAPTRTEIAQAWVVVNEDGEIVEDCVGADAWVKAFGSRLADPTTDHEAFWHANEATIERLPEGTQATLQDVYDGREAAIKARNNGGVAKTVDASGLGPDHGQGTYYAQANAGSTPAAPTTSLASSSSGSAQSREPAGVTQPTDSLATSTDAAVSAPATSPAPNLSAGVPAVQENQGTIGTGNGSAPAFTLIDVRGEMIYGYENTTAGAAKYMKDLEETCEIDGELWQTNYKTTIKVAAEHGLRASAKRLGEKYKRKTS